MAYKYSYILCLAFCLSLIACKRDHQRDQWAEAIATIIVDSYDDGYYWYTITYDVPYSTALNKEGRPIKGTIAQHGMDAKKLVYGQKLKIRYMREEPIIFEFLEPKRYEK